MLSKDKRLNLKTSFKWVAAGKRVETRYLRLFLRAGDNRMPRVGIAVSSKFFPKATARNRARRLISAAFEVLYSKLPAAVNIVVLPKAGVTGVKSQDVLLDLEEGLKKAEIL